MLKKVVFPLVAAMVMMMTIGYASPLTDYSQGKTSIDITWRPSLDIVDKYTYSGSDDSTTDRLDGRKATFDWRITSGLGNNCAIQYNHYRAIGNPEDFNAGIRAQELNLLYRLNKNTAAFAGYHRAKFNISDSVSTPNKNTLQAGLIGNIEIAKKTDVYGIVGFGKDLVNYEVGISYELAKDIEFNVDYRYKKVKNLSDTIGSFSYKDDVTAKGVGCGITYKF